MAPEKENTPPEIPKIDFSAPKLQPGTENWSEVRAKVMNALESYGCFEAVFPRVSPEARRTFLSSLEDLFALPVETKERNVSDIPYFGYFGRLPYLPLMEGIGIFNAGLPATVQDFCDLMWPQGNPNFREMVISLVGQIKELDHMVRRMVVESLGVLDKYYESHIESTEYLFRMMKYRGTERDQGTQQQGLVEHTDSNTITILFQNHVMGLQVQTKDGDWIPAETSPESFIVLAGASLMAWTNGRVHAAHHRVMMEGKEERYSVALFSVPRAGYLVQAPEELVDEKHPLLFKPFDCIEIELEKSGY
ncbi:hypothetical protein J5N97_005642 [Dioscorea zingiberensis]|uniref:2-oxoglutarate-dependent dioxygenase DAO n=1 Tax=Dioscorea zingiberensis TaxID=325984 RepID=A0A9D5HSW0_9LILI|nr:hypothetical protein J5N97_005642 [Dioscorea zingiberensis]